MRRSSNGSILLLFLAVSFSPVLIPQDIRPTVRAMIDSVSVDRLRSHVDALQKAGGHWSRVTFTPGNDSAVQYVYRQFKQIPGLSSVVLDTFYIAEAQSPYDTKPVYNVTATIRGTEEPKNTIVLGAHIDCSASRMGSAIWQSQWNTMRVPGADDNASGVAAVLELARVMSHPDLLANNRNTIVFTAFGAEEGGPVYTGATLGSLHYASTAKNTGENVLAMFSLDMIGFNNKNNLYLNIAADSRSQWLGNHIAAMNDSFAVGLTLNPPPYPYGAWSDHARFWAQEFSAVLLIECAPPWINNLYYNANPYYHLSSDTLETLNMELIVRSARLALASSAMLSVQQMNPVASNDRSPFTFVLGQNYPNPFNAGTTIAYSLRKMGHVSLRIYTILGEEVRVLAEGYKDAGEYSVNFNPVGLPSGVYYYRLTDGFTAETKKMVLIQ